MKKNKNKSFFVGFLLGLMFLPQVTYAIIAYIPETLRECMLTIQNNGQDNSYLQELCAMIKENRIFASDRLVRQAAQEALLNADNNQANYINQYVAHMERRILLPALHGNKAMAQSFPIELVVNSLEHNSADRDMIYLASQFATRENMEVCGFADIDALMETNALDTLRATISFAASSLISAVSPYPNIILGTGIASPIITGWAMSRSSNVQSPITMQFGIPSHFSRYITIGLHFVVTKQNFPCGKIKIELDGSFINNDGQFTADETSFSGTSKSIRIIEPDFADEFRHVYVKMSGWASNFSNDSLARLSFIRVQPHGVEYAGDIFLVAAEVIY